MIGELSLKSEPLLATMAASEHPTGELNRSLRRTDMIRR
jgi:hypothetical protein